MEETKLKFKSKLIIVGNSFAFIVPKAYVSNGLLDEKKSYDIIVEK